MYLELDCLRFQLIPSSMPSLRVQRSRRLRHWWYCLKHIPSNRSTPIQGSEALEPTNLFHTNLSGVIFKWKLVDIRMWWGRWQMWCAHAIHFTKFSFISLLHSHGPGGPGGPGSPDQAPPTKTNLKINKFTCKFVWRREKNYNFDQSSAVTDDVAWSGSI